MNLSLRLAIAVSVVVPLLVAGCAGEPSTSTDDANEMNSAEGGLSASCTHPRRYVAVVAEGECTKVTATRGRWAPSPLFEDAPEGSGYCIYTWDGESDAPADRAALEARFPRYDVGIGALAPLCGEGGVVHDAALEELPFPLITGQAGSVGCDVCGIVEDNRLWVVLPPEYIRFRKFNVKLSNGGERSFKIAADRSARAVSLPLPEPPAGTHYVEGRVRVD